MNHSLEGLQDYLQTSWLGKNHICLEETESTTLVIKALAKQGAVQGTLVTAEYQSAGRGRLGRKWETPKGSSIAASLLLRPDFLPEKAPMLTLLMGYSAAKALNRMGASCQIKWPNDLVIGTRKICGILTEMGLNGNQVDYVTIGFGVNVSQEEFPEEIALIADSLTHACKREFDRKQVLAEILKEFERNYERFTQSPSLEPFCDGYNNLLVNRNKTVKVLDPEEPYTGTAIGINAQGELIVEMEDKSRRTVFSGEVSVRGLYGYV